MSIILCIPGPWADRTELIKSFLNHKALAYVLDENQLNERETGDSCQLEIRGRDERLHKAMEVAGEERLSAELLEDIEAHSSVVYLRLDEVGLEAAGTLAHFATVLLSIGGLAVKVEHAGKAFDGAFWAENYNSDDIVCFYNLFVSLVAEGALFLSCGMDQFGLPDCSTNAVIGADEGAYVMNVLNIYQLTESPSFEDDQTFCAGEDERTYTMTHQPYPDEYEADSPLNNSLGRWHLQPLL